MIKTVICALLLLIVSPAWGAITESNSAGQRLGYAGNGGEDSHDLAFPLNVTSGCLLIVGGAVYDGGSGAPANIAVSSTKAIFTSITAIASGELSYFLARGVATSSGADTVTVNPDGTSAYISFGIDEFCGTDIVTPLDADGGTSTGTSTTPSDSITTTTAGALVVGVMTTPSTSSTITPSGSYTEIYENEDSAISEPMSLIFEIKGVANTYAVDWTVGATMDWFVMTNSFKAPAAVTRTVRRAPIILE